MSCYIYKGIKYTKEELIQALKQETSFGEWRYELVDDLKIKSEEPKAIFSELFDKQSEKGALLTISDIVSEELTKAYPQFLDIKLELTGGENGTVAYYHNRGLAGNVINLGGIYKYDGFSYGTTQSIILHEVQHAIQDIEGFSSGASKLLFDFADNIQNKQGIYNLLKNVKTSSEASKAIANAPKEITYRDTEYTRALASNLGSFSK